MVNYLLYNYQCFYILNLQAIFPMILVTCEYAVTFGRAKTPSINNWRHHLESWMSDVLVLSANTNHSSRTDGPVFVQHRYRLTAPDVRWYPVTLHFSWKPHSTLAYKFIVLCKVVADRHSQLCFSLKKIIAFLTYKYYIRNELFKYSFRLQVFSWGTRAPSEASKVVCVLKDVCVGVSVDVKQLKLNK